MIAHIVFILATLATIGVFAFTASKIFANIKMLKKPYSISNVGERVGLLFKVVLGQSKIFRLPLVGFMHALVLWGFIFILVGSLEMVLDGFIGVPFDKMAENDRVLHFLGIVYDIIIAGGDISAFIILVLIIMFLVRRNLMNIKRFTGSELRHKDHKDATFALFLILMLMASLLGMNAGYVANKGLYGIFPVSSIIAGFIPSDAAHLIEMISWWTHILLIFFFANYLPFSKHFHVFMSTPNVYFSRTEPLTKMRAMESVTNEVKLMMDPDAAFEEPEETDEEPERFGMKDVEDGTWKNYIDSLTCTQCGRCTSVCPANQTGKKLSPRKVILDYRRRMEEKSPKLRKEGKSYDDGKALYSDYTSFEELWACTTCNACAQECPMNIDHPSLILELRRYIFMEESAAPSLINMMSTNIENNGAPWQYSAADRLNWADELYINE